MALRVILFGNGPRGVACLKRVMDAGHTVCAVVAHAGDAASCRVLREAACAANMECLQPVDPNQSEFVSLVSSKSADVFVLAGYSPIIKPCLFDAPRIMTINTHAGELPAMRGSSPLNWALIEGRTSITLSIIRVNTKVDGGEVLTERLYSVTNDTTIAELQDIANNAFPEMIVATLSELAAGNTRGRTQDDRRSSYYPLRFPDDGMILWDQLTAVQVHNRIRALTDPYPGAFTYAKGHRIRLMRSELSNTPVRGEPGRVYRKTAKGLLVCATDQCLWITSAIDASTGRVASEFIDRYDCLATVREAAMRFYETGVTR